MTPARLFSFLLVASSLLFCVVQTSGSQSEYPGSQELIPEDLDNESPLKGLLDILGFGDTPRPAEPEKFKSIITFDGGGLRCLIAVDVLERVEKALEDLTKEAKGKKDIYLADYFYAFSGVNCGAWIASYLASKCGNFHCSHVLSTRDVEDEYGYVRPGSVKGLRVFFEMFSKDIYPPVSPKILRTIWRRKCAVGVLCPTFPGDSYREVLTQFLGNADMTHTQATLVLPMYDLRRRGVVTIVHDKESDDAGKKSTRTFMFEGNAHPLDPRKEDLEGATGFTMWRNRTFSLLDVTQAAGARVAQHSALKFSALNEPSFELICQDSSLLFNNPTFVALAVMMHLGPKDYIDARNLAVLSIGTGVVDGSLAERAKEGTLQWNVFSRDFYAVVIHGGNELVQAQVDACLYAVIGHEFYGQDGYSYFYGQYLRIQAIASAGTPHGEALMSSSDVSYKGVLRTIGRQTAERFKEELVDFVSAFVLGQDFESRQLTDLLLFEKWNETAILFDGTRKE